MNTIMTKRDYCLRALQQLELKLLKELDRICRKYDIQYSLGGGTCLGQIRHGGFIPWDDDIDVDMTVPNFTKFAEVAPTELDAGIFRFTSRATNPKHLRSCARLELKYTSIVLPRWKACGENVGIFIDIFQWNYLPDWPAGRKAVSTGLFLIRAIEHFKMYKVFAAKSAKWMVPFIFSFGKFCPLSVLYKIESKLVHCCGNRKTGWIIDDAIINGNHGGYPSIGVDEYTDVQFEGLTVRNKKNPDNFMHTIYGPNCYEWLPNIKRISHHRWVGIDFGPYEKDFRLPENYADYLTNSYNLDKIQQMKKVSMQMVTFVSTICEMNGIDYCLVGADAELRKNNLPEFENLFLEPVTIAVKRENYDRLCAFISHSGNPIYFLQNHQTDPHYNLPDARLRLKYTVVHEAGIPLRLEEKYENGFFIRLSPIDVAPADMNERKQYIAKIDKIQRKIDLNSKGRLRMLLSRKGFKVGIKYMALLPCSFDRLLRRYQAEATRYARFGGETKLCVLSKNLLLETNGSAATVESFCGCSVRFPTSQIFYKKNIPANKIQSLSRMKDSFPDYYNDCMDRNVEWFVKNADASFAYCQLNYFDSEEYQLSVLRYDEKADKYLSNDELFQ